MSTLIPGVVGPSYWSYTSLAMVIGLERAIETGAVNSTDFPQDIVETANEFFELAEEAVGYGSTHNFLGTSAAYLRALQSVGEAEEPISAGALRNYRKFLKKLRTRKSKPLTPGELETAIELRRVFATLRELGVSERYVTTEDDNEDLI